MEPRYVSQKDLLALLHDLDQEYSVVVPVRTERSRSFVPLADTAGPAAAVAPSLAVGEVRSSEPVKAFFFSPRQTVARDYADEVPQAEGKPLCLVGVKACDLKGFRVMDAVFAGDEYQDPFYTAARQKTLIISADCTSALDVCFCLSLGVDPYPQDSYDLNLSEVEGGYVVQPGSEKGTALLGRYASYFRSATAEHIGQRDQQRTRVRAQVQENIRANAVPAEESLAGVIQRNFQDPLWAEEAATCVECGACNTICPTCHCFLLFDQLDEQELVRLRVWDSCLLKDFAKVAAGANPRPQLWMRLRNRFEKKFDYFPKVHSLYACTGCGRCILACAGKIDIRRVLKRNVENVRK